MALHLTYCHEEMVRVSADCQLESSVMTTIDSAKADPLCRNAAAMCIQNSTVESLNQIATMHAEVNTIVDSTNEM